MYKIGDKEAAIRELQGYLYEIYRAGLVSIPRVPIDGFYGNDTRSAVTEIQRLNGISESGAVDYETFTKIYGEYLLAKRLGGNDKYLISDNPFPFKVGDRGEDIEVIHILFRELLKYYPDLPRIQKSSYFSEDSARFAREIQEIFAMTPDGTVSKELYDRIITEISSRRNK